MIQFDVQAWRHAYDNATPAERRSACKYELLSTIGHHHPGEFMPQEIEHIYARFHKFKKRSTLRDSFNRFLTELMNEGYLDLVIDDQMVTGIRMKVNARTKPYLRLMPCLQAVHKCNAHGCAHTVDCEAYQRNNVA